MIKLSAAALTCARQPGYSELLFSDVKTPPEQATARMTAAEDLIEADDLKSARGAAAKGDPRLVC